MNDPARELIRALTCDHLEDGACPDEVAGWESRDQECPGCRALDRVEELVRRGLDMCEQCGGGLKECSCCKQCGARAGLCYD